MAVINFPILYINDPFKGIPLFAGQLFVGEPDLDPTIIGNQKQLRIVQEDGTKIDIGQPMVLSSGGVPTYNGAAVRLDVDGNYSIKILDKEGAQTQYYIDNVLEWQVISELDVVAIGLNVPAESVIDSLNTTDSLDPIEYIRNSAEQITWAVPELDSTGKTIVEVVGDILITTGGTGSNTYTLIIPETRSPVNFASVQDMQNNIPIAGGPTTFIGGMTLNTGATNWKIVPYANGLPLVGTLYAMPVGDVGLVDFGAVADGATPARAAIQLAVDAVSANGGTLISTQGSYLMDSIASPDTLKNGILIPFTSYENDKKVIFKGTGTVKFVAGDSDMIIFRAANTGCEFYDITLDAGGNANVWGVGAVASDRFADVGVVSQSHLKVIRCRFIDTAEGVVVEPARISGGSDSGAFYPQVLFSDFRDSTRGIWLKGATDATANRPTRGNIAFNRLERGNSGIDLEYATETTCVGNNFEFINEAGPLAQASAYHLGAKSENNYIYGGHSEGATLDINNEATVNNNMLHGFTLLGINVNADKMSVNTASRMRLTKDTAANQQMRYEAILPSFAALVFDYATSGQKSAAIELNGANQMEWFNGVTRHIGSSGTTSFSSTGVSVEGSTTFTVSSLTSFLRLRAGADAVYIGTGGDDYRLSPENIRPVTDGDKDLGEATLRFGDGFFVNTPIGSSDKRLKTEVTAIPDLVLDAWALVEKQQYKWVSSVVQKGNQARWHVGVIAQDVVDAFASLGLDAHEYGVLCFDKWERQEIEHAAKLDEAGEVVREGHTEVVEAGDRFGIRYGQAAQLDAALERRERIKLADKIELLLSN